MLNVFYVCFLAFFLSFPVNSKPNPPPPPTVNTEVAQLQRQIDQLQSDLKAAKNNQADHDSLVTLNKGLPDLEKRVEDIHQYVAYWGWFSGGAITLFGILLTVLIIYFSFRATHEAKLEAGQVIEKWLDEKSKEVMKPIEESLQNKGNEILIKIQNDGNKILENINKEADTHHQKVTDLEDKAETLLDRLSPNSSETGKALDPNDVLELHRRANLLRPKPESQYSFDDWWVLYLEAADRNGLDDIDKYINGMEHVATGNWQNAVALHSRAWLLDGRQRYAEAIELLNQIIEQHSTSNDPRLIERVAKALFNKGCTLRDLKQWQDAIKAYDEVVSRYDTRSEAGIAEQVASALFAKGNTLGELKQWQAAAAVYDDVISRCGTRSETGITELVAKVQINREIALRNINDAT